MYSYPLILCPIGLLITYEVYLNIFSLHPVFQPFNSCFFIHYIYILYFVAGLPIVFILLVVPGLMPWEVSTFLSWCHIAGSVSPWIGSFLYHLFMNIDYGEGCYCRLLQLDMLGIWISQSFGTFVIYRQV